MPRPSLFGSPGAVGLESALFNRIDKACDDPDIAEAVYERTNGRRGRKRKQRQVKLRRPALDE